MIWHTGFGIRKYTIECYNNQFINSKQIGKCCYNFIGGF